MDNVILYSSKVLLSESEENPDVYIAKFVICDFFTNKNGVALNRDTIESWMSTLTHKPLVGKIKMRSDGELDFSGHNVVVVEKVDEDGNKYQDLEFLTDAFGTFTNVSIENIDGVECIVATAEIWKRFTRACEIIKRRVAEGTLHTSWEISVVDSIKRIVGGFTQKLVNTGRFIGHCLLGEDTPPAYDSSGLLEIASVKEDTELSMALSQDILESSDINATEKEDINLSKTKKTEVSEEIVETVKEENIVETNENAKTENVIEEKPNSEESSADSVEANTDEAKENSENKDDDSKNELSSLKDMIDTLQSEIDTKNDAIIKASEEIQLLKIQVSELAPFKEKFEKIEQERIESEIAESKKSLVSKYVKTGLISKDEFASSEEIKGYIDSLNEKALKELVATRYMASLEKETIETSEVEAKDTKIESASANLCDDEVTEYRSIIKTFLDK